MDQLHFPELSLFDNRLPLLSRQGRRVVGESKEVFADESGDFKQFSHDSDRTLGTTEYELDAESHSQRKSMDWVEDVKAGLSKIRRLIPSFQPSPIASSTPRLSSATVRVHSNCLIQPVPLAKVSSFTSSAPTVMDGPETISSETTNASTLPNKTYSCIIRNLRFKWLIIYRRLSLMSIIPNVVCMIILATHNSHGLLSIPFSTLVTAVSVNLLASVLIRQEFVINILFIVAGQCPKSMPLRFKRRFENIYHLGGVHSGAAIAATAWFGVFSAAVFSGHQSIRGRTYYALYAITAMIDLLLLAILFMSIPQLRRRWHDQFEWSHRFGGWTAVALFWTLFIILTDASLKDADPRPRLWNSILTSPILYILCAVTGCLVAPWLNLRKVPVVVEELSNHAVRLHFAYANSPLCSAPRLSDNPLREWHAFASIPEPNGVGFSVLVSKAGDWTGRMIRQPPKYLYKRGWMAHGVLYIAPIFNSMVIVCTGSGIGPVLSLLKGAKELQNVRIVWSTKNPLMTYRQGVVDDVFSADPHAIVIDTSIERRPDLAKIAYNVRAESGAEAVFVISNPCTTKEVVYALESRGVPTFAPIFDS